LTTEVLAQPRTYAPLADRPPLPDRRPLRHRLPDGWPLSVLLLGFPLWWVAGMSDFIFILMAVPMALQLLRRPGLVVPRGFGVWVLFLVWTAVGVLVLRVHAPGSVDGGGANRIFTFGYRFAMYLAITTVLLYVGNLRESELARRRIARLIGFMFVVTAVGGTLGVVLPNLEFHSLMELVLPKSLTSQQFVASMIHPKLADISSILGYEQPRPVAPFAYANTWGSNLALYLPFFLIAWLGPGAGWRRWLAPVVIVLALIPTIFSLDRGLWLGLALGLAYAIVRLVLMGKVWVLAVAGVCLTVFSVAFLLSPLSAVVADRFANPHSNEGRGNLSSATVSSTIEGSPLVGYGGTRNVQGTFTSIAGGATAKCPGCENPPLGTQGTIWTLIFTQGFVGALLFLAFFAVRFWKSRSDPSPYAIAGCAMLLMTVPFLLVYDLLGAALFTIMVAVGLMWRLERERLGEIPDNPAVSDHGPAR
jgi:hypothetical protein